MDMHRCMADLRVESTSLEKGQSLMRICIAMDPDFFITVLHVPDGPHFSKSGTAMVVPVVAGATPLGGVSTLQDCSQQCQCRNGQTLRLYF